MPGASARTRLVKNLNANWRPDEDGGDGRFEIQLITEDDQRFSAAVSPVSLASVVALVRADTVLAWDPANATLIAANIVGQMPWTVQVGSG